MLFHSQVFLLGFLPVVLLAYYALARRVTAREWMLVLASLFFYAWWDVRFLPLLVGQAVLSWGFSQAYFMTRARWLVRLAIILNLGVLGLYKYLDFFVVSIEQMTGFSLPRAGLILPIGISFYTFQIVSYLIDLLRAEAPRYSLRRFSLFVVLFPQLVAGPIVRHNEIVGQFDLDPLRPGVFERVGRGLALFTIALAAKVFIADRLALFVDPVFAGAAHSLPGQGEAWTALFGFGFQIFFDFAAYSEMAIGIALAMGLELPMNFNQPYRATSLQEFWRRWHMTLSRFLRDYLYIPLGGSRHGAGRYVAAILTTMGLCGLWHGAGWTFVIWGLAHGLGLIVNRAWKALQLPMPALLGWALTFSFAIALFGLFRAPDLNSAGNFALALVTDSGAGEGPRKGHVALVVIAAIVALQPFPGLRMAQDLLRPSKAFAVMLALLAAYSMFEVGKGAPQNFIYFQF